MYRNMPRNDNLILDLLDSGKIVVTEDFRDDGGLTTKIFVRDDRSRNGKLREQRIYPKLGGHPYFSIYPNGRAGKMVWLSARRVVWYANNPVRTGLKVCPIDNDPWNFNIGNLCLRDQNDQNYLRILNQQLRDGCVPNPQTVTDLPF